MVKISKNNALLSVENLSVCFGGALQNIKAVQDVSFDIRPGELLALVGESGSGKSVTALSIMQLLPYPNASHPQGKITFDGKNVIGMHKDKLRQIRGNRIAMIFQEPMTSLNPLHTIEKQITESLQLHEKMDKGQAYQRCLELLDMVELGQLKDRLHTYPHELSGGQRQRVMIAMALACNPELLIADEPTTALDVTVQMQILDLLKDLQKKMGMSILLITHDLNIVRRISDRVCVMQNGKIVETGITKTIFKTPKQQYTKDLIASEPKGRANDLPKKSKTLIKAQKLKVSFPVTHNFFGRPLTFVHAVKDANIQLMTGETLGIVGESGSGKTTLAMAIIRLISSQGVIKFNNQRIDTLNGASMRPLRREMQVVFQDPFASLNPRMTILQIIEEGLRAHNIGASSQAREIIVCKALEDVELDVGMRGRYPHEFSGGQRQRIAIARALVLKPKLIILDEPTSALDVTVQAQVIELLKKLQTERELSYIFISHDLNVVKVISHRVAVMQNGNIVEMGDVNEVFSNPQCDYTKVLLNAC